MVKLYFPFLITLILSSPSFKNYSSEIIEKEGWNPMMISSYLYSLSNSIPKYGIITDEENYLSLEDQNSINEELETINVDYNLNGYFIIVSSLNSNYNYNKDGMKLFCKELKLYLTKNNSEINEDNIFIVIYAIDDEMNIFNAGKNVNKKLSNDERKLILTKQKNKIKEEKYNEAFIKISNDIKYYMNHCRDCNSFLVRIGFFIFTGIIILILLIMHLFDYIRGRQISKREKRKIKRMENFLNKYKKDKDIIDKICFICMNDINDECSLSLNNSTNEENSYINENKIKILSCKHQYHDKCYYEWINRQDNTCPLCVEKLDKNDNFKDTYVKIISIQKCLHRNFNELEFDFVEGKLTYKFIKGLHKNDFSNLN